MTIVVLSPHTDDAIFSCGAYLTDKTDVQIVTPFAAIPDDEDGRRKHETLHREHGAACQVIKAEPVNGPFLDDVYAAPKRRDVRTWLSQFMACETLLVPFGIHHPDHTLTTNMTVSLLYNHTDVPDRILFYEELPYRVDYRELADMRFAYLSNVMGRMRLFEEIADDTTKRQAVNCYTSQTGGTVIDRVMVRERIWELVR